VAGKQVMEMVEPAFKSASELAGNLANITTEIPGVSTNPNHPLFSGKLADTVPIERAAKLGLEAWMFKKAADVVKSTVTNPIKGVVKNILSDSDSAFTAGAKEGSLKYVPSQERPVVPPEQMGGEPVPPVVMPRTTPLTEEPKPLDTSPKDMLERVQKPAEETLTKGTVEETPVKLETDTGRPSIIEAAKKG